MLSHRPNSEPDYQKLFIVHSRPHKSYIGAVYLCASRLAPIDVLNSFSKTWFSPGIQNLQPKTLEPILSRVAAFATYLEENGSYFS